MTAGRQFSYHRSSASSRGAHACNRYGISSRAREEFTVLIIPQLRNLAL
jgi:hypothetical protein